MRSIKSFFQAIQSRPRVISLTVIVLLWAWIGLTIVSLVRETNLSESDLLNRETRIDQEKIDEYNQRLETYQQPAAFGTPTTIPFQVPGSGTN